ncbi:hypothetical protein SLE2022_221550 [Rubroshorea leprosula]
MNDWLSFPIYESLNQDLAIQRFCPASAELEQGEWEEVLNEIEIESFSPSNDTGTPQLAASEVDDFVDSIINIDDDLNEREDQNFPITQQDNLEEFAMVNNANLTKQGSYGLDQGLYLVHLLLACADAVGCRDTQLAESILGQIWACASPWGDSLQRVSYCFAVGLKSRLSLLQNVNANGTFTNCSMDVSLISREEKIAAFHLLYQTTPCIGFGFMAANEAMSQAAQGKDLLHII